MTDPTDRTGVPDAVPAAVYKRRGQVEVEERDLPAPDRGPGGGGGRLLRRVRLATST